jgi:competence protein ComFC
LSLTSHNTNPQARSNTGLVFSTGIRRLFDACINLIFPPRCAGCGRVDEVWCEQCTLDLESLPVHFYLQDDAVDSIEKIAFTGDHAGILREAVQGLKYNNVQALGELLGKRLADELRLQNWTFDMMIPVPLHADRLKERGYNQAQVVCEHAAAQLGYTCLPQALKREISSHSQVGLSAKERKKNVAGAFSASSDLVSGCTILIVDDVCTTGSTLAECAQALIAAGALKVYGLTLTSANRA